MQNYVVGKNTFRPLNPQEEIFVAEYLTVFSTAKAARAAGYDKKTATQHAHSWLRLDGPKQHVARAIRTAVQQRLNRLNITADAVISELGRLGFSNMGNFFSVTKDGTPVFDLENLTENETAAIKSLTIEEFKDGKGDSAREVRRVKLELHDKKGPLLALAKHLGVLDAGGGEGAGDDGELAGGGNGSTTYNTFNINLVPSGQHYQEGMLLDGDIVMGALEAPKHADDHLHPAVRTESR